MNFRSSLSTTAFIVSALHVAGCMGDYTSPNGGIKPGATGTDGSGSTTGSNIPFSPLSPAAYTTKVKNILTGLPATSDEVAQVEKDPTALKGLIATWQKAPTYAPKMVQFLSNAFQQSQVGDTDFAFQGVTFTATGNGALLLQNLQQQVAQTVLMNDAAGKPLSDAFTTANYALTPALAAFYAYVDTVSINDNDQALTKPAAFTTVLNGLAATDFTTWSMVSIRKPASGEATTTAAAAKTATTLVLNTPRVGFFTTPSFFAGWQTNLSNSSRVTTNQMMIVALNHAIDGTNVTKPLAETGLDPNHAAPGTACYGCHINLDPMRQFFRNQYSIHYNIQTDSNQTSIPGNFGFGGVAMSQSTGIGDLGTILGTHPMMPAAWVQKLCTYADDAPCVTTDAEFTNVVNAFTASNESWSALVQDLFSSPLVTYASRTATGAANQAFPVAKKDHLCPELNARLSLTDVCVQSPATTTTTTGGGNKGGQQAAAVNPVQLIANILPANGYSRGSVLPVLANDPSLFFRAGMENICAAIAPKVVDAGATSLYTSTDPTTSIADMVHNFMGINAPNDAQPIAILTAHFNSAMAMGSVQATDAMQSTFVAACLSPSVVGIGQ